MTDWNPQPWPIDPEHGRVTGPGFLGDSFHSLRVRELFRYYQPPTPAELHHVAPINLGNDFVKESGLVSAVDPILAAFANLVTRVMDMRRCVVSMTGAGTSYIIAESTRSLSLTYPHTHDPEDALMLGGGTATSSLGGLCEHTCSLLPPPPDSDEPFLLEIPDLSKHPKFCNVGYVRNWPHARFYCGAPLRTKNGVTIGTVCIMDERTRYSGLTPKERLTMASMADMFMQYFETKEGSRFRKKGQLMELELSRFISEGFMPPEGAEMAERRNGRLWNENILKSKREQEEKRKKKVLEKRQTLQEIEYGKMVRQAQEEGPDYFGDAQEYPGQHDNHVATVARTPGTPGHALVPTSVDSGIPVGPVEDLVPVLHPLQPGVIEMVPASRAEERARILATVGMSSSGVASPSDHAIGTLSTLGRSPRPSDFANTLLRKEPDPVRPTPSRMDNSSSSITQTGETDTSSSVPVTVGTLSEGFAESTAATSTQSHSTQRKRSKYEETVSMEPHYRAMFARAATVIKNTVDCDVVFVHGDLEGFFEPEFQEGDPHSTEDWDWSHVSSDKQSQSQVRAQKPKQQRQSSGVLGYATSKGSSSARFDGPRRMSDLGFDMSELREEHISFLLKDSKEGRIFAFFDEYPGLEEHEDPEEVECQRMLRKFLPGCRSVIVVPLYDYNSSLASICFAWTCSDQKTFYGDEEGRFVSGVATSLMDEMARMHILSADKAKSEFISSISHELRSPLHGILASGEFLIESDLRPDQRSFVETIISCGTTLLDTVNHVLDFQKLNFLKDEHIKRVEAPPTPAEDVLSSDENATTPKSTGTYTSNDSEESLFDTRLIDTDFSTIVQEVTEGVVLGYEFKDLSKIFGQSDGVRDAALFAPTKVSKIQVIVDIEELEGGWTFRSNPAAIKRIVGNIVGNAIKYSQEAGWVKVTLTGKKLTPAANGAPRAKISFIVSDSGRGMSREFLKTRLFTPFTQENPMAAGAGLGLSIVRQLVDMHNGKIDVKSQLGRGTTFRIEMKLTQATPRGRAKPEPLLLPRIPRMKALLVGFERFDHTETSWQRGETLLYDSLTRYARELLHIDVILDGNAPEASECEVIIVNELAAATKLHDLLILKNRPVIALCNSTPRRSVLEKFDFDRDPRLVNYVRKPCGPKKLLRAFEVCLDILTHGLPESTSPASVIINGVRNQAHEPPPESYFPETECGPDEERLPVRPKDHSRGSYHRPEPERVQSVPLSPVFAAHVPQTPDRTVPPASTSGQATASAPSNTKPLNILCVEDNKINMMLVTTYLKKKKYAFKMACDGAEAVERFKEEASQGGFDCILMDLQMPVMSGIESTREIRHLETQYPDQYKRCFIIALTGLAAGSDRHEAFNAGVDAFMVKPVSFKDLEEMLQSHVRKAVPAEAPTGRSESVSTIVELESTRGKNIEIKRVVASSSSPGIDAQKEKDILSQEKNKDAG